MRTEDHGVSRLDGHDALEEHRGGRIGNGSQREDDADRLGHFDQIALGKLADDADGALVFHIVVDKFGGHHVLDGLVFENAEPGFLDRQTGQVLSLFQSRPGPSP